MVKCESSGFKNCKICPLEKIQRLISIIESHFNKRFYLKQPLKLSIDPFKGKYNHVGAEMDNASNTNQGIRLLIQKCREEFKLSENTDFYSDNDYRAAERKFVKFCLRGKSKPSFHWRVDTK